MQNYEIRLYGKSINIFIQRVDSDGFREFKQNPNFVYSLWGNYKNCYQSVRGILYSTRLQVIDSLGSIVREDKLQENWLTQQSINNPYASGKENIMTKFDFWRDEDYKNNVFISFGYIGEGFISFIHDTVALGLDIQQIYFGSELIKKIFEKPIFNWIITQNSFSLYKNIHDVEINKLEPKLFSRKRGVISLSKNGYY